MADAPCRRRCAFRWPLATTSGLFSSGVGVNTTANTSAVKKRHLGPLPLVVEAHLDARPGLTVGPHRHGHNGAGLLQAGGGGVGLAALQPTTAPLHQNQRSVQVERRQCGLGRWRCGGRPDSAATSSRTAWAPARWSRAATASLSRRGGHMLDGGHRLARFAFPRSSAHDAYSPQAR